MLSGLAVDIARHGDKLLVHCELEQPINDHTNRRLDSCDHLGEHLTPMNCLHFQSGFWEELSRKHQTRSKTSGRLTNLSSPIVPCGVLTPLLFLGVTVGFKLRGLNSSVPRGGLSECSGR
eukprot:3545584-Amphidinium_carterae.1